MTFEADVETENDLEWTEWDRERDEQVTENETLVESVGLSGSAKVSVDPETKAIKEVTLVTIDQDFIEVEEAPSRRW